MRSRWHRISLITVLLMIGALAALCLSPRLEATPEYSMQTGLACTSCHESADGGGRLTREGETFKAAGFRITRDGPTQRGGVSLLRLLVGMIHVVVGLIWFGTVFYIHIFVGPAELERGLPRREVWVGRISILTVFLTGIILTFNRIHRLDELWTTTFGIVWTVKFVCFLLLVIIAALATTVLDSKMRAAAAATTDDPLVSADGQDGRPAHIGYEGEIYDVTESKMWKDGLHMRRHHAGRDLTAAMAEAPHGAEVLARVTKVGPMSSSSGSGVEPFVGKLFYFLTYFVLFLMLIVLLCVAYWRWGTPLVAAPRGIADHETAFGASPSKPAPDGARSLAKAQPPAKPISDSSKACAACHQATGILPAQIQEWRESRHHGAGVGCYECHKAEKGEVDAFEHNGFFISTIVSPKDCSRCHAKEVNEFTASRHADGGNILASLDNVLGEVVEGVPAAVSGCRQCHGAKVEVLENGRLAPTSWPNTGIGRINPDGSKGSCSACHGRHRFSAAVARRPENCGRCHMGPDHPQFEIYKESKHGIAFVEGQSRMNLTARKWRLGKEYTAAPTCVSCHSSANSKLPSTHDVGQRIAWTLRPAVSIRQEAWQAKRGRMRTTCLHCHSPGWADNFFRQFDAAVTLWNEKFAQPAGAIMAELRKANKLTPTQFDENIEWIYFLLWHHEGRRARHGASMMGPDYTQWHGFFEVAHRFYMEFLPEAEHLLPGVTTKVRASDDHQWLKGMPDALRKKIKSFYKERYTEKGAHK